MNNQPRSPFIVHVPGAKERLTQDQNGKMQTKIDNASDSDYQKWISIALYGDTDKYNKSSHASASPQFTNLKNCINNNKCTTLQQHTAFTLSGHAHSIGSGGANAANGYNTVTNHIVEHWHQKEKDKGALRIKKTPYNTSSQTGNVYEFNNEVKEKTTELLKWEYHTHGNDAIGRWKQTSVSGLTGADAQGTDKITRQSNTPQKLSEFLAMST